MLNTVPRKYQIQTCWYERAILSSAIKYHLYGFCSNSDTDHNAAADAHNKTHTLNKTAPYTLMVKTA
jgi:hypothetical protein